jgi:hypothetical protein
MPQAANPGPGVWLMAAKRSASFTIFIPIRQKEGESSNLYLYYGGLDSNVNRSYAASARKHLVSGDLQERLTVWMKPKEGAVPAKYVWQLDEQMPDAVWVREILTGLANTRSRELKEFLGQCFRDAKRDPAKPFRAVFSTSAKTYHS